MDITSANIAALTTDINTQFNRFLQLAPAVSAPLVMDIPSTSAANFYPNLVDFPGMRKWVGSRVIHRLENDAFVIKNETYENTIAIKREHLEDDLFGIYKPFIAQLGKEASGLRERLIFDLVNNATGIKGMDGQYFFDTDHVTYDEDGKEVTYSNVAELKDGETAGPAWYLFKCDDPLKPFIYQTRRPYAITQRTKLTDDNVFFDKEFIWGADGRSAAGCGMWQFAYRSTRPLTIDSLADAMAAMGSQRRSDGQPYGIEPTHLFAPTTLRRTANAVVKGGMVPVLAPDGKTWLPGSNPVEDSVKPVCTSRLNGKA
ncbi:Mu-like prophage major head subunit gpT family protein [Acetobacter cibinongensis]|uniref:Head protein n=1 Tax=Acetobacter cibinongensis TaxID=146475 RepID=A0A1Z5YR42_9PROT|nr:Mu-like prophage major head subunit gpT family protein [Acetobacter cibinongensis]OUI98098.1 head protein [Acetobacter cibinongensis]